MAEKLMLSKQFSARLQSKATELVLVTDQVLLELYEHWPYDRMSTLATRLRTVLHVAHVMRKK